MGESVEEWPSCMPVMAPEARLVAAMLANECRRLSRRTSNTSEAARMGRQGLCRFLRPRNLARPIHHATCRRVAWSIDRASRAPADTFR